MKAYLDLIERCAMTFIQSFAALLLADTACTVETDRSMPAVSASSSAANDCTNVIAHRSNKSR